MYALISNDAGGAEFVARYARKQKGNFCLSASGPAIQVFRKHFKKKKYIKPAKL